MRVYLPATMSLLRTAHGSGELGPAPVTAFAVTPALREWYASADTEELEYAATVDAARASLRLLDADPLAPRRRVVIAADVPEDVVVRHPELDRAVVRAGTPVPLAGWVSVLLDGGDAEADVRAAAAAIGAADLDDDDARFTVDAVEDHELEWYDVAEVPALLGPA